ncbi:MAG: N-acetyltransferase family protein [Salinirussus sp.]
MTREYPDEPAGDFPAPPVEFDDGEGRRIRITESTTDDREPLTAMYRQFDPEDRAQGIPPVGEARIREWLDALLAEGSVGAVARHEDQGQPVGHAVLVPDAEGAYELAIFVLQEFQGAGIGTNLLEALLGLARREGVERVWLSVERWNSAAIRLYERTGFERVGRQGFELEMTIRL